MIYLITALHCEAAPLIKTLRLKQEERKEFSVFSNARIRLCVCGIGKIAAAAACSYLFCTNENKSAIAWLNIGIAGHQSLSVGEGFLANKILDTGSSQAFYPQFIFNLNDIRTSPLHTYDSVVSNYPANAGFDMEASGFYASASRFSSAEMIHCYKIVSDNPNSSVQSINKSFISELVTKHLETITSINESLEKLSQELESIYQPHPEFEAFLQHYHFTKSQKLQLHSLLLALQNFSPEKTFLQAFSKKARASQILNSLKQLHREQQNLCFPLSISKNP